MTRESQHTSAPAGSDDEIDLRNLFRVLWAGKWLIASFTIAATVIAIIVALMLPNVYRAEALLAPNDQEGAGGLSALASQYGGLASLAGISIDGGFSDKTTLGLEILKSRKFISEFVESHDILVPLIAAKGWDSESGRLAIDPDDYDVASGKWIRHVSPPRSTIPTSQEAYEEFMDILSVSQDKYSGFISVAVEHYSPTVAKQWVDWLVDDLNSSIMRRDVAEAEQAIEYLSDQIKNTSVASLQNVFFNLIEEQLKTVMLAEVTDEYLFRTLDPAIAPDMKTKPKRSLIVILSALLGFFLAMAAVLLSTFWRQE
jgi:uncharacterized protein involved in exopolysaccharide biosynthesis